MRIVRVLRGAGADTLANLKLVGLHWSLNAAVALGVGLPALAWLSRLDETEAADALLTRISLPTLLEITPDPSAVLDLLLPLALWLIVFALVLNTFVSAGVIGALTGSPRVPMLRRFLPAGGRYFPRFLKLFAFTALVGGIAWMVVTGVALVIAAAVAEIGEPAATIGLAFAAIVSVAAGCFVVLALHFARIRIVLEEHVTTTSALLSGIRFVARNALQCAVLIAVFGLLTGVVYAVYLASSWIPATTAKGIWRLIACQQAVMLARSALQVGLVAAELRMFGIPSLAPPSPPLAPEPTPSEVIRVRINGPAPQAQPPDGTGSV